MPPTDDTQGRLAHLEASREFVDRRLESIDGKMDKLGQQLTDFTTQATIDLEGLKSRVTEISARLANGAVPTAPMFGVTPVQGVPVSPARAKTPPPSRRDWEKIKSKIMVGIFIAVGSAGLLAIGKFAWDAAVEKAVEVFQQRMQPPGKPVKLDAQN